MKVDLIIMIKVGYTHDQMTVLTVAWYILLLVLAAKVLHFIFCVNYKLLTINLYRANRLSVYGKCFHNPIIEFYFFFATLRLITFTVNLTFRNPIFCFVITLEMAVD